METTMTSFAGQLRAGGPERTCRRGLWLTFLSPFGLEVAVTVGGAEWIGIDVQHGDLDLSLGQESVLDTVVVSAIESVIGRTRGRGRVTGIFAGSRKLTRLLPAVDLLGVDTDAAALRAGLKLLFEQPG
jgi:2-keto-3-deoxy-L-rhamnonate aldolase RhmA